MFLDFLKKSLPPEPRNQSPLEPRALPLEYLQTLIPIGSLPTSDLLRLNTAVRRFNPGESIFTRGETADSLIYLHSGQVFMESQSGHGYMVDASTFKACFPLSTCTEHSFSAIAKSITLIAYLPLSTLQSSSDICNNSQLWILPDEIPPDLVNSQLFHGFCIAFDREELLVPSLPDVALRLRNALQKDIGIADAVKIVNLDPAIASKLIQVVNSPLYRPLYPISNCHDAINRLGLKTTQNLVTSISLSKLFRSRNQNLNNRVFQLWKNSVRVASLSYTLANLLKKTSSDEALLAGLIHNIGALPIIHYADTRNDPTSTVSMQELDRIIELLQAKVGEYILKKWHFPENLQRIPNQTSHWYFAGSPDLQVNDIVLLARFHAQIGTPNMHKLPPLNTLPAFSKLTDSSLTPDLSLKTLYDAKQQIAESLIFFKT